MPPSGGGAATQRIRVVRVAADGDVGATSEPSMGTEERTVRAIFELANRGLYAEALRHYMPDAHLELAGGELSGGYAGTDRMTELIGVAIKEYGQPRVRIDALHATGPKVYVETSSRVELEDGQTEESREVHILEFSEGKVRSHRIFTSALRPPRLAGGANPPLGSDPH